MSPALGMYSFISIAERMRDDESAEKNSDREKGEKSAKERGIKRARKVLHKLRASGLLL